MNARKRNRTPQLEQLEEDIRQIGALLREGRSPEDALAEFRRRLDHDHMKDLMATVAMVRLLDRRDEAGRYLDPEWVATAAYQQAESMLLARTR
jgi:hypothetical protein